MHLLISCLDGVVSGPHAEYKDCSASFTLDGAEARVHRDGQRHSLILAIITTPIISDHTH